jgi:hypothetical protein
MIRFFLRYLLPALVFVGAVSFGIHKHNEGIRAVAVEDALKKERAQTQPVIALLADWVVDRDKKIKARDDAYNHEFSRQKEEAKGKQKIYDKVMAQNEALKKQAKTAIPSAAAMADGVRVVDSVVNTACTGDSDAPRRLGIALKQCESDLNRQLEATAEAAGIAAEAIAAARALKN